MRTQNSKKSILVVDDYDDIRKLIKKRLEKLGFLVLEAGDGQQAVEMAEREHPDLILMDFNLPILDGFVATQCIRQLEEMREVPIVGLTAHGKQYSQNLAKAAGCNDYLEKPLKLEQLDALIERWLPKQGTAKIN
jgi:CheY-like chemotaxis protein